MTDIARKIRIAPSVPFCLEVVPEGGMKRTFNFKLAYDFYAFSLVEQKTGFSMLNGAIFRRPTATTLAVLMWAALQCYHSDEYGGDDGLIDVQGLLSRRNADAVLEAVHSAFIEQLPPDEKQSILDSIKKEEEKKAKGKSGEKPASDVPLAPKPEVVAADKF